MGTFQFEPLGVAIMVKLPQGPPVGGVAGVTVSAQAVFVFVVAGMTASARRRRCAELGILVAAFTGHQGVEAQQGKTAQVVVEARLIAPAFGGVTALTALILRVAMNVVEAMTADATGAKFFGGDRPGMATAAGQLLMFVLQGELRFLMIKNRSLPALVGVTTLTFSPIKPGMPIRFLMAGEAISFQLLTIELLRMAKIAGAFLMLAFQLEFRLGVIKFHLFPGALWPLPRQRRSLIAVAGLTFLAIASAMGVVQLVAAVTVCRDVFPFLIWVAKGTADLPMHGVKFKLGFVMVKGNFFP